MTQSFALGAGAAAVPDGELLSSAQGRINIPRPLKAYRGDCIDAI
jgi:hypothetical protein